MTEQNEWVASEAMQVASEECITARQAFELTTFERASLAEKELKRINLELEEATSIALGTLGRVRKLLASLPEVSIEPVQLRQLEFYAYAAVHAQVLYKTTFAPSPDLDATYREASQLRKQLRHDAENLGLHGLLDIRGVRRLRLRMGHRNVGYDLLALVNVLIAAWPNIAGSSALNRQQLAHAERTAESLLMLSATKSETRKWRVRADDERRRAFTLLFRAYDRLRRALAFIRWDEGDLAALAPALHTTKGAGRPKRTKAKVSPAAAPETFVSPRLLPSTDTPDD